MTSDLTEVKMLMAGVAGLEPAGLLLESSRLTINEHPFNNCFVARTQYKPWLRGQLIFYLGIVC